MVARPRLTSTYQRISALLFPLPAPGAVSIFPFVSYFLLGSKSNPLCSSCCLSCVPHTISWQCAPDCQVAKRVTSDSKLLQRSKVNFNFSATKIFLKLYGTFARWSGLFKVQILMFNYPERFGEAPGLRMFGSGSATLICQSGLVVSDK